MDGGLAHYQDQLQVQHMLYDIVKKAEQCGFTHDELSLMAYEFGIQYKPSPTTNTNRNPS